MVNPFISTSFLNTLIPFIPVILGLTIAIGLGFMAYKIITFYQESARERQKRVDDMGATLVDPNALENDPEHQFRILCGKAVSHSPSKKTQNIYSREMDIKTFNTFFDGLTESEQKQLYDYYKVPILERNNENLMDKITERKILLASFEKHGRLTGRRNSL